MSSYVILTLRSVHKQLPEVYMLLNYLMLTYLSFNWHEVGRYRKEKRRYLHFSHKYPEGALYCSLLLKDNYKILRLFIKVEKSERDEYVVGYL